MSEVLALNPGFIDPQLADDDSLHIEQIVASNLSKLRAKRQLSLDALARRASISRTMLSQIEGGRSVPTIRVLHQLALALKVSIAAFLDQQACDSVQMFRAAHGKRLVSLEQQFVNRQLSASTTPEHPEFSEVRMGSLTRESFPAYPAGSRLNLVVSQGVLELVLGEESYRLGTGDAIQLYVDQGYSLRNPTNSEVLAYQVLSVAIESR